MIAASFCNTVEELYFCVGVVGGEWSLHGLLVCMVRLRLRGRLLK